MDAPNAEGLSEKYKNKRCVFVQFFCISIQKMEPRKVLQAIFAVNIFLHFTVKKPT
jgi:hypothetical protein